MVRGCAPPTPERERGRESQSFAQFTSHIGTPRTDLMLASTLPLKRDALPFRDSHELPVLLAGGLASPRTSFAQQRQPAKLRLRSVLQAFPAKPQAVPVKYSRHSVVDLTSDSSISPTSTPSHESSDATKKVARLARWTTFGKMELDDAFRDLEPDEAVLPMAI